MASNGKLQVVMDFLLNMKSDPSQVDKMLKDVEAKAADLNIGINTEQARKAISQIVESMGEVENLSSIDFNILDANIKKQLETIATMAGDVNNVDLSKLQAAFDNIGAGGLDGLKEELQKAFDSANLNSMAEEFQKAKKESENLYNVQRSALAQMKMTGSEGSEAYMKLENEIKQTESVLKNFADAGKNVEDVEVVLEVKGAETFIDLQAKFESIGAVGEKISEFADRGNELNQALNNMKAVTNATGEEFDKLRSQAEDAFKSGVGESVAEAVGAIAEAKRQLGSVLNPDDLLTFAKGAAAIGKVFDKDINEVIGSSRTFISSFGLSGKEAFELMALGLRDSASKQDDFIDSIDEYSVHLKRAGFDAKEFVGVLNMGIQEGVWNTDKLGDAIKETNIRLAAGDISKGLEDLSTQFGTQMPDSLKKTLSGIVKAGEQGKLSTKEVMQQMTTQMATAQESGQISDSIRDSLAAVISGTMAEDMGGALYTKIFSTKIDTSVIEAQAKEAGLKMTEAMAPATIFQSAQKSVEVAWTNVSAAVAPLATNVGGMLSSVASVAPALSLVNDLDFKELKTSLLDSASAASGFAKSIIKTLVPGLFAQAAAQEVTTKAQAKFNTVAGMNPYFALAAGIVLFVGLTKVLADALHETAAERKADLLEEQKANEESINSVKSKQDVINKHKELVKSYEELGSKTKLTSAEENKFRQVQVDLAGAFPGAISNTKSFSENLTTLKQKVTEGAGELKSLQGEVDKLMKDKIELNVKIKANEVAVKKEDIENTLTDSFKKASVGDWLKAAGAVMTMPFGVTPTLDAEALKKTSDTISDSWFGTSQSRKEAEAMTKRYTDAIYAAKDSKGVAEAVKAAKMGMNKELAGKDPKLIAQVNKQYDDVGVAMNDKIQATKEKLDSDVSGMLNESLSKSASGVIPESAIADISKKTGMAVEEVAKMYNEVRGKANNAKVDKLIEDSLTIKKKISNTDTLNQLAEDFNKTSDAVKKAQIGDKINAIMPSAVKTAGIITDSNGKAIQSYTLVGDKLDENATKERANLNIDYSKKTSAVTKMLSEEGDAYDENFKKVKDLDEQIKKAPKGTDTSGLQKQYDLAKSNMDSSMKSMVDMMVKLKSKNVDNSAEWDMFASKVGKTTDEVKKIVNEAMKLQRSIEAGTASAKEYADAWNKARTENTTNAKTNADAILGIDAQIAETKKRMRLKESDANHLDAEAGKEILKNLTAARKKALQEAKDATNKEWDYAKEAEKRDLQVDEVKRLAENIKVTKEKIATNKDALTTEQQVYETALNQKILDEKREKNSYDDYQLALNKLSVAKQQQEFTLKGIKESGLITEKQYKDEMLNMDTKKLKRQEILDNLNLINKSGNLDKIDSVKFEELSKAIGMTTTELSAYIKADSARVPFELIVNKKMTTEQKADIDKQMDDANNEVTKASSEIQPILIKTKLADDELNKALEDLKLKKLEVAVELGTAKQSDITDFYNKKMEGVSGKLKKNTEEWTQIEAKYYDDVYELQKQNDSGALSDEKFQYQLDYLERNFESQKSSNKKNNTDLKNQQMEIDSSIRSSKEKDYQDRLDKLNEFYSREQEILEKQADKQLDIATNFVNAWNDSVKNQLSLNKDIDMKAIDDTLAAQIDALDAQFGKKKELSELDAQYEKRKKDLEDAASQAKKEREEKYRKQEMVQEAAHAQGLIQLQIQKDAALLTMQKDQKEKELKILEDKIGIAYDIDSGNPLFSNEADKKAWEKKKKAFDDIDKEYTEKTDLVAQGIKQGYDIIGQAASEGIAKAFAGDLEGAKDSLRKGFASILEVFKEGLIKYLDGIILKMIFGQLDQLAPTGLMALVAVPVVSALITGTLHALADPIFKSLSFATGVRFQQPTLLGSGAIVGDGSRMGGDNPETLLRDPQLLGLMQTAIFGSNELLNARIDYLTAVIASQTLETKLKGEDIYLSMKRTQYNQQLRAV